MSQSKAYLEIAYIAFPENDTELSKEDMKTRLVDYIKGESQASIIQTEWGVWCHEEDLQEIDLLMGEGMSELREEQET